MILNRDNLSFYEEVPSRRVKILRVEMSLFLLMLQGMDGERRIKCVGIPADAKTVGIFTDRAFNTVEIAIESNEFPETPVGLDPPFLRLEFQLIT